MGRKILSIFLAISMIALMTSCGGQNGKDNQSVRIQRSKS